MHSIYDKQFRYDHLIDQFHNEETKINSLKYFYSNKEKISSWYSHDTILSISLSHFLDQIDYEIQEMQHSGDVYMIDILYRKAQTYLLFMKGLQHYEQFLLINNLIYDDVLIIWRHLLINFHDRCINDFYEQKSLQYAITTALLSKLDESLIPFLYDIAVSSDIDVAISAIVGLSQYKTKFSNWSKLYRNDSHYDAMIDEASSTDIKNVHYSHHNNIYLLFFYCRSVELYAEKTSDVISLMNSVLSAIPENHILFARSVEAIEHLLFRLTSKELSQFSTDTIAQLIMIMNSLQPESVLNILQYWEIPSSQLIISVKRAVEQKHITLDDSSNIATFLYTAELLQ